MDDFGLVIFDVGWFRKSKLTFQVLKNLLFVLEINFSLGRMVNFSERFAYGMWRFRRTFLSTQSKVDYEVKTFVVEVNPQ
mgnify:FL=1